ncbi:MAG: hypothetical protein JWP44_3899, partial [Mucilaginibacter sp.]|nr:hypothetical protein [Mucilaginibacter sp.]
YRKYNRFVLAFGVQAVSARQVNDLGRPAIRKLAITSLFINCYPGEIPYFLI